MAVLWCATLVAGNAWPGFHVPGAHRRPARAHIAGHHDHQCATAGEITYANVYEGLTYINGEGQIRPRLATEWQVSADGRTVDFKLRQKVLYQ